MHQNGEHEPDCLAIGDWWFDVAAHELGRNGETVRLEPRVSDLLEYLALRPGQPVSRAALLEALWPGMVVSDEALTNAVNKLRRAFGDDRANPRVIETLPKTGYRLIAQVRPLPHSTPDSPAATERGPAGRRWLVPVVALLLAGLSLTLFIDLRPTGPPPADSTTTSSGGVVTRTRPALAVLPFEELGADSGQAYFADGITDDIITRLAKNPDLVVIARDSTFFYKGKSLDPRTIAQRLDVGYVLRGSLRREGDVLKLNTWLVDAGTDAHVWAEHFERPIDGVFDIQNSIYRGVVGALTSPESARPEPEPGAETDNPRAYDSLLLGKHHFYRFESRAENLKARAFFQEAVRLDPGFAAAHAMLAWTYAFAAMNGWADDREAALKRAQRLATHATGLRPDLSLAYFVRGLSYREQKEYVKALVEAEKAIEFDPNDANGHVLLATLLYYAGRPEEGLARIREAMRINPHHPYNYHFHLGQAYFVLHRYPEAIDAFQRGLSSNPASERMRVWLAAALARSGDVDSAQWEAEQIRAANADFSLQRVTDAFPFKDPDDMEQFLAGLRLAGLE
jgi:TolB-like protein/DNA-binding winged helix-turn-helix (wHTH) protein